MSLLACPHDPHLHTAKEGAVPTGWLTIAAAARCHADRDLCRDPQGGPPEGVGSARILLL